MLKKGLVQIYTGDGKGKTTAAMGLALRAAGRGNRVLIYQFLKPASLELGERKALDDSELRIEFKSLPVEWDMARSFGDPKAVADAKGVIARVMQELTDLAGDRQYDVMILDEIVFCVSKGLASPEDVRKLIKSRAEGVELVLTGRGADEELIGMADLVTEMKCVKHPYDSGIGAREGIEY